MASQKGRERVRTGNEQTAPSTATTVETGNATSSSASLDLSCFIHTPYYCEENVHHLCKKLIHLGLADPNGLDLFVVFVSNEARQVPLWWQKASKEVDGLVVWDYHVFCIQSNRNTEGQAHHLVWDLDSNLAVPFPLNQYVVEAIRPSKPLPEKFRRLFRVIHAPNFIRFFASDRSHMRDSNGNWMSSPPSYKPIVAEDGTKHNLNDYIQVCATNINTDLNDLVGGVLSNKMGVVVAETQLEDLFSQIQNQRHAYYLHGESVMM